MKTNLYPYSVKCKRPRFGKGNGKGTWDYCKVIDINGKEIEGFLDTSYGQYFYFNPANMWNGWRKTSFDHFDDTELIFDFREAKPITWR